MSFFLQFNYIQVSTLHIYHVIYKTFYFITLNITTVDNEIQYINFFQITNDGSKRSIFELVRGLCGQVIPGIPLNPSIPPNSQERVKLLHWLINTTLTFLKFV